jgi:hypothetical protein
MVTFDKLNIPTVLPTPGSRGYKRTIEANWDDLKAAQHDFDEAALRAKREADQFGIAIARLKPYLEPYPELTVAGALAMINHNRRSVS